MKKPHSESHSELIDRAIAGTRWATVLRLVAQTVSWLSTILVVRFISPEDYGINTMLESVLLILMFVSTLGLESALVQKKEIREGEIRSVFGWLLVINGTLFLLMFLGSGLMARYYNEPRIAALAQALAFLFILIPFRVIPNALLDRNLEFKLKATVEMLAAVIAAGTTLTLAALGFGVWALVIGVLVNRGTSVLLLTIRKPWLVMPSLDPAALGKMASFGGILTLSSAFFLLSDMLVAFIAGPRLGAEQLGIYAVAAQFALLPLSKGMPLINQTLLPVFSKFQEHKDLATYYLERLINVASIVFIPVMVGLACVSEPFVMAIIGAKWSATIGPLALMSVGMILRMSTILYRPVMISMGRPELTLYLSVLQFLLLLLLTFMAIPYGVTGLVLAWLANELVMFLATLRLSKRVLGSSLGRHLLCIRAPVLASLAMALAVLATRALTAGLGYPLELALQVIAGAAMYYLVMRFVFTAAYHGVLKLLLGERFSRT